MEKRNKRLTGFQQYQLFDYAKNNLDKLNELTILKAINHLTNKLNFPVSERSTRAVFKEFKINFSIVHPPRMKNIEVKIMKENIKSLAHAIHELYVDIGSKPHPSIIKILLTRTFIKLLSHSL